MDWDLLRARFGLPAPAEAIPLRPGTEARVWRLNCERGSFLVRTLSGPEQGGREWTLFRHLADRGFDALPSIRLTLDGQPAAELDGVWYQLQTFCPGSMPDPGKPGVARRLARTVLALEQALEDCPCRNIPAAKPLPQLWAEARPGWTALALPLTLEEADRTVARLSCLPVEGGQVIHGDLGPWNMLDDGERIRVIDFGAVCLGDPYYDLAAALGGVVNHTSSAERDKAVRAFWDECRALRPDFDRKRLLNQVSLWAWRGLTACARPDGLGPRMAVRFFHALRWKEDFHGL